MKIYIRAAIKNTSDEDDDVRCYVASDPNTRPASLAELARDYDDDVRTAVADNPNTPPEVLAQLATDTDWRIRERAMLNPNMPLDVLSAVIDEGDRWDMELVAANPSTPVELLQQLYDLAYDTYMEVDILPRLAKNPNTPIDILEKISNSKIPNTLCHLAENPNITPEIAENLAFYPDSMLVRLAAIENPNTSNEILRMLEVKDTSRDVREKARIALQRRGVDI